MISISLALVLIAAVGFTVLGSVQSTLSNGSDAFQATVNVHQAITKTGFPAFGLMVIGMGFIGIFSAFNKKSD